MIKIMKTALVSIGAVALFTTSAVAGNRGVGVSVTGDTATIRGDIMIQENLRLEPYFGMTYRSVDVGNTTISNTTFNLGTAAHMIKEISPAMSMYYGGFLGFTSDDPANGSSFNLGPVAGVEYAFDPQFTLGAEVSFNMNFGDTTVVSTDSAVILRYYFD